MIDTFVDAFMYEPASIVTTNKNEPLTYIHYPPPSGTLHPYIKEFAQIITPNPPVPSTANGETVDCGVTTIITESTNDSSNDIDMSQDCSYCVGTGEYPHWFMSAEGYSKCSECKVRLCLQCTYQKEKGDNHLCTHCLLPEVAVSQNDIERTTLTHLELRERLRKLGIEATKDEDYEDLLDMYESRKDRMEYDEETCKKIKAPVETALYLQELQKKSITSFDLSEGGEFLVDSKLTSFQMLELLKILTSLVTMYKEEDDTDSTKTKNMKKTYKLVPKTIIFFAEAARLHSGYRLVWRCIRHAIDPQTHSIVEASGHVVEYKNEICLLIYHHVKASMKSNTYQTVVCFSTTKVVACSCSCIAGGKEMKKCYVYILYQLFTS
jgi:hypothetical protein